MNTMSGLKKYYVGFSVLMIVALAFFIYAISQASAAKTDRTTNKSVEKISTKLDNYISDGGSIPDSLGQAGIDSVAPTVKYTKPSDAQYKVCIDYKTAAGGFDASWASLFGGIFGAGGSTSNSSGSSYFDPTVESSHKKGENCQTVKPYLDGGGSLCPLGGVTCTNDNTPNNSVLN